MTDLTPTPLTGDIQVNTETGGSQIRSSVAALDDGGFVAIWESSDGSGYGVYGQRYDATGVTVGGEFRVNTYTSTHQSFSSVAGLDGGGFVVMWSSDNQDGSIFGTYGQRYDANGTAVGGEFRINTYTQDSQLYTSVAALDDGGFTVIWASRDQDGSSWGIYGQRYDASGAAAGDEFRANTYTINEQYHPSVAALDGGGFVVTWDSYGAQDGSGVGIYGQRYDAGGNAVGGEFRANSATTNNQTWSNVAGLGGGGFVVTWTSNGQDGSGFGIYGQRYAANGTAVGGEFQVNTATAGDQMYTSAIALGDGGFIVTWSSNGQDGSGYGVYGQRFDANDAPVGDEFRLNQNTTGDQVHESWFGEGLAGLANGTLVSTWHGFGSEEIFVRLFDVPHVFAGNEDQPVTGNVLANDTDPATGDTLSVTNAGTFPTAQGGTVVLEADGDFTYTPATNWHGSDSFDYAIRDMAGLTSSASVSLTIAAVADVPLVGIGSVPHHPPLPVLAQTEYADANVVRGAAAVAPVADGSGFMMVWHEQTGDAVRGLEIYAQIYDIDGRTVGPRQFVNTTDDYHQVHPQITALTDGTFIVVWQTRDDPTNATHRTYAQHISASGEPIGSEFLPVNLFDNISAVPEVLALQGGGYLVTLSDGFTHFGRVFNNDGSHVTGMVGLAQVEHPGNIGGRDFFAAGASADGGFFVAWQNSQFGIRVQQFDERGSAIGAEVVVRSDAAVSPLAIGRVAVIGLADGGFAVAYMVQGERTGEGSNLQYAVYAADGSVETYPTPIEVAGNRQHAELVEPTFAALDDGGFVLAFGAGTGRSGRPHEVLAIRFEEDGTPTQGHSSFGPIAGAFLLGSVDGGDSALPEFIDVIEIAGGRLVAAWDRDASTQNPSYYGTQDAYITIVDLGTGPADGVMDQPLPLSLSVALTDTDGSETITSIIVSGLPAGFTLSAGTSNGDGSWSLTQAQLAGLTLIPPSGYIGSFVLTLSATSTESANGHSATSSTSVVVRFSGENSQPTAIVLSNAEVVENAADGTVIGTLTASDPNSGDSFTFQLLDNADGRFVLSGSELRVADGIRLDHEQAAAHTIRVSVTDAAGASYQQDFVVALLDRSPEFVIGDARHNTFVSGAGNDRLTGGEGADTLTGGAGNDIYDLDRLQDVVIEMAGGGTDFVTGNSTFALDLTNYANVENAIQYGSGDAALYGSATANALYGNAGDNVLDGRGGADMMIGRDGDDTYYVDNVGDLVREVSAAGGSDTVVSSITYALGSNVENLVLAGASAIDGRGNSLANTITGNDAANYLRGQGGDDTIDGGGGNDYLFGGAGRDTLIGGEGFDVARYDDAIYGDVTANLADPSANLGVAAGDTYVSVEGLAGGRGNDTLIGDASNNLLIGNAGDDWLAGGDGIDRLQGGAGSDTFAFETAPLGRANFDYIVDFSVADDTIALDAASFGFNEVGAFDIASFMIGEAATESFHHFIYDDATGMLYYDADGIGGELQVAFARLHSGLALTADDFRVIGSAA